MLSPGAKLLTSFTKQNSAPVKDVTIEMIDLQQSNTVHIDPNTGRRYSVTDGVSNWVDDNNIEDSSVSTANVHVDENSGRRYSVTELGESVWIEDNEEAKKKEDLEIRVDPAAKKSSKRRSFIKVTNDENGEGDYFQDIETNETVWEIPVDGDLVAM